MNFRSTDFMFDKGAQLFAADVSELTDGGAVPLFNRASRSLTVISHKTGVSETFVLSKVQSDIENDIMYWEFAPINPSNPITIRVFND